MRIGFFRCREQTTPFEMSCVEREVSDDGAIKTNDMSALLIEEGGSPNLLLNSTTIAFVCGGGREMHIEGYFIGEISQDACNGQAQQVGLHMKLIAHGHEGSLPEAPNYDVYIDGRRGEEWDFAKDWRVKFSRPALMEC